MIARVLRGKIVGLTIECRNISKNFGDKEMYPFKHFVISVFSIVIIIAHLRYQKVI